MNIYLGNKDNENVYEDLNTLNNVLLAGGPGGGQDLKMSGEVITLVNGKFEKLQQKPFGDKVYL